MRLRHNLRAVGLLFAAGFVLGAIAAWAHIIPAGVDCWVTECGETRTSFCNLPIPPDFFEPGSEVFDGEVNLEGRTGTNSDTHVLRRSALDVRRIGSTDSTAIELVQLDLVSCEPITVMTNGSPVLWDVAVSLSPVPPPPGQMTVSKEHPNGGEFSSEFFVQPLFTFTKVDDPTQVRVLDTGLLGLPPDRMLKIGPAPWVERADPATGSQACAPGFVPGVREVLEGRNAGSQCCVDVCHSSATATHCVVVGTDCSGCPSGACCLPGKKKGRCRVVKASQNRTAEMVCQRRGGSYGGDGTDCSDTDGDGIEDIKENNDCCAVSDVCSLRTSPTNPDTDGDGVDDGVEVERGTDPCVPD